MLIKNKFKFKVNEYRSLPYITLNFIKTDEQTQVNCVYYVWINTQDQKQEAVCKVCKVVFAQIQPDLGYVTLFHEYITWSVKAVSTKITGLNSVTW